MDAKPYTYSVVHFYPHRIRYISFINWSYLFVDTLLDYDLQPSPFSPKVET